MAVAYQSIATLAYGSHTNSTCNKPIGTEAGDTLFAWFGIAKEGTPPTPTVPEGWELVSGTWPTKVKVGTFEVWARLYKKAAGASEPTTYTWTHTVASSFLDIVRVSGSVGAIQVTQNPKNFPEGGTTSTYTGITTAAAESEILLFHHDWGDKAVELTAPTGTTPTFTRRFSGALAFVASGTLTTAGATGNKTMTNNSTGSDPWVAVMVAVEPEVGGTAWKKELADTQEISDAAVKLSQKILADTSSTSDALINKAAKLLADTVAELEALSKATTKVLADTQGTSDSVTASVVRVLVKTLEDTVAVTDSVAAALTKLWQQALSDTVATSDALTKSPKKALTDSAATSDAITKRSSKALSDALTASDALAKGLAHRLSDAVTLADSIFAEIPIVPVKKGVAPAAAGRVVRAIAGLASRSHAGTKDPANSGVADHPAAGRSTKPSTGKRV
jgi:hypothetical protein